MKVVAINGSPRKNGNTKLLLEAVLQPLRDAGWQAELIQVGGLPIQGCRACGKCIEKQNRNNGIAIQRNLFVYFITP